MDVISSGGGGGGGGGAGAVAAAEGSRVDLVVVSQYNQNCTPNRTPIRNPRTACADELSRQQGRDEAIHRGSIMCISVSSGPTVVLTVVVTIECPVVLVDSSVLGCRSVPVGNRNTWLGEHQGGRVLLTADPWCLQNVRTPAPMPQSCGHAAIRFQTVPHGVSTVLGSQPCHSREVEASPPWNTMFVSCAQQTAPVHFQPHKSDGAYDTHCSEYWLPNDGLRTLNVDPVHQNIDAACSLGVAPSLNLVFLMNALSSYWKN